MFLDWTSVGCIFPDSLPLKHWKSSSLVMTRRRPERDFFYLNELGHVEACENCINTNPRPPSILYDLS